MQESHRQQVSFAGESLILVDAQDKPLGHDSKVRVHAGDGVLHRAFSIFLFRDPQTVLLHKRSAEKPLWPGYWTNSCCSHPRRGESNAVATQRRMQQELGLQVPLRFLYRFQYAARYRDLGSERELCSVYIGALDPAAVVNVNESEIAAWDWFDCAAIDDWLRAEPDAFTPWFKLEWAQLRGNYGPHIEGLFHPNQPQAFPLRNAG